MARRPPRIPLCEPVLGAWERQAVLQCLKEGYVTHRGRFVEQFESRFARFCGVPYGIATTNGTAALHLALVGLEVGAGDEVIVPALTYVATASAVAYTGARPVFADVDPATGALAPATLERLVTRRTRGIIPVHLYGQPAPMTALRTFTRAHGLFLLEDAAEAHGARVGRRPVGGLGDCAAFSFYGNKILTTGEGGMITTGDRRLADQLRHLRNHGQAPGMRYWHDALGFNYRMTNLQGALGVAQLRRVRGVIRAKRRLADRYRTWLADLPAVRFLDTVPGTTPVPWLTVVRLAGGARRRDAVLAALAARGIEAAPVYPPLPTLPVFARGRRRYPGADRLAGEGLCLPSGATLARAAQRRVADALRAALEAA